ncbi:hypothetical protein KY289_001189 [Solanum tuberosum]|nr:hypothetical protein KY289_001189 [Solanum tuberosum]
MDATIKRIQSLFYWKSLSQNVRDFINKCDVCQRHKYDVSSYPGLQQPLPILDGVWTDVCLDFIEGLPKSNGKNVILVVLDRLSKYGHFMSLKHPYIAQSVALCFLDNVFKLHGMPATLTSDRDHVFLSKLCQELFTIQGVQLQRSISYHPQTDGQTKVLNRTLETYLRCFCSDRLKEWSSYLPLAEWWYNTTYHTAIKCTPYEVLYGQKPPIHLPYLACESSSDMVDRSLVAREAIIHLLKFHIQRAQQRMKDLANQHRSDRCFEVGDWVYLKLQPYRQVSVAVRPFNKLAAKYFSPYPIAPKVGLKKCHEVPYVINHPPVFHLSSPYCPRPEGVLDRRLVKRGNQVVVQVLVKWTAIDSSQATWEYLFDI